MKIRVTFKTPDAVDEAIDDRVARSMTRPEGVDQEEWNMILDARKEALRDRASEWFRWGEYCTVEWDTEANTCTVVKGD